MGDSVLPGDRLAVPDGATGRARRRRRCLSSRTAATRHRPDFRPEESEDERFYHRGEARRRILWCGLLRRYRSQGCGRRGDGGEEADQARIRRQVQGESNPEEGTCNCSSRVSAVAKILLKL